MPPIAHGRRHRAAGGDASFTFTGTAGQLVEIFVDADDTTTGTPNPDLTLLLFDPSGDEVQFVDTGTNPESLTLELPADRHIHASSSTASLPPQFGDFLYRVQEVEIVEQVLSDYNLLFFLPDGTFVGALAEQNLFTNRPLEIGGFPATERCSWSSRAPTRRTPNRNVADRIRYVGFSGINPQEYFSYLDPVTYGHNSAAGAMGVAAYAFFAPFVPEAFTSPGSVDDLLRQEQPTLSARRRSGRSRTWRRWTAPTRRSSAATRRSMPTRSRTSSAPARRHRMRRRSQRSCWMQRAGPASVKPKKMRKILQDSAFRHDLDPYFSSGFALSRANLLAINAIGRSERDQPVRSERVHADALRLASPAELLDQRHGRQPDADAERHRVRRANDAAAAPPGQPFVVGRTVGLDSVGRHGAFSLPADPPGLAGQWKQLDLTFLPGTFGSGDLLSFGVDRDEADAAGPSGAAGGNSADLLGGGVLIPSGQFVPGGAQLLRHVPRRLPFSGEFFNLIGNGYSQLDGYGFINAEAAVKAVSQKE